jgi:hypothetical protein
MKTATISELKQELQTLAPGRLLELCLRLTKYKKENKELLTYLLFEADDEQGYIVSVKKIIDEDFAELPKANLYLTKKSLRKTLRITNKFIKYTASKQVEAELLIYFCLQLKESGIPIYKSNALGNLFQQQLKKIQVAIAALHEDLQHDFTKQLSEIS